VNNWFSVLECIDPEATPFSEALNCHYDRKLAIAAAVAVATAPAAEPTSELGLAPIENPPRRVCLKPSTIAGESLSCVSAFVGVINLYCCSVSVFLSYLPCTLQTISFKR